MDKDKKLSLLLGGDQDLLQVTSVLRPVREPEILHDSTSALSAPVEDIDEYEAMCDESALLAAKKAALDIRRSLKSNHSHVQANDATGYTTQTPPSDDEEVTSQFKTFCPILAVKKIPYRHMQGPASSAAAKMFFDGGKFWELTWDLYYLHLPSGMSGKPLLLVPAKQAQELIRAINETCNCDVLFPTKPPGFLINFEEDGTPQPTYLGRSQTFEMKEKLESRIPADSGGDYGDTLGVQNRVSSRSLSAFRSKMEDAVDASRVKKRAGKAKRLEKALKKQGEWADSLEKAQGYLGYGEMEFSETETGEATASIPTQAATGGTDSTKELSVGSLIISSLPAPSLFKKLPVFICIDVESNEHIHSQITEIGVSTLDTKDLLRVHPGPNAQNWSSKIISRHFRIQEHSHVVNKEYVSGCPDRFDFGHSEFVQKRFAVDALTDCFRPPFSKSEGTVDETFDNDTVPLRCLILVGHSLTTDIRYLENLGCKWFDGSDEGGPHICDSLDTEQLYRTLKRESVNRSLAYILDNVNITAWNLHNAGNDARYTLEAMLAIVVKSVEESWDRHALPLKTEDMTEG